MTFRWLLIMLTALTAPCQAQLSGRTIVLDPGHGGTDPGSLGIDGSGYPNEEDMVLDVALRLRDRLMAAGAEVFLTRETDATVSLTTRRDLANAANADLFLSIHANSFTDGTAQGTETYHWSFGDPDDVRLAGAVQRSVVGTFGRADRGVKQANFTVLTANPPAALAELMFISNQVEFNILKTSPNRELTAKALFEACADYLQVDIAVPVFTLQPQAVFTGEGTPVVFSAAATGADLTWRWQRDGIDLQDNARISGASTASLTIQSCRLADAGFYTARAVGGNQGAATSASAQLIINTPALAAGSGGGLRGHYFTDASFFGCQALRQDPVLDFDWEDGAPLPGFSRDQFSVRWIGQLEARYSQDYRFHVRSPDTFRILLDGAPVAFTAPPAGSSEHVSPVLPMVAGRRMEMVVEHLETERDSAMRLSWSSASQVKEVIPATQLYRAPPLLTAPMEVRMVEGGSAVITPVVVPGDPFLSLQSLTDFGSYAVGTSDRVLFRKPNFTSTTLAFVEVAGGDSALITTAPTGTGPFAGTSTCLGLDWRVPAGAVNPWLRLTTSNAMFLGNPVIDFRKALRFSIRTAEPIRIGLGLRETNSTGENGTDGGRTGTIEYVGVGSVTTRPEPVRSVLPGPPGVWQTLEFDPINEPVRAYTGDGTLTSTTGKGVLEHLCIVPENSGSQQSIQLDNFALLEPNRLTWSLLDPVPGATIHPATGVITWQPAGGTGGTGGAVIPLTVVATDSGTPARTVTQIIRLNAVPPPVVLTAMVQDGQFSFSWTSAVGANYQIESAETPAGSWQNVAGVTASGATRSWTGPALPGRRFYRARWIP